MEDVGNGDHLRIYVHNKTSQTINVDLSFDLEHRSLSYKNDTILPDSIPQLCGIGFKDVIGEKAILTLREEFHNKHLVNLSVHYQMYMLHQKTTSTLCAVHMSYLYHA